MNKLAARKRLHTKGIDPAREMSIHTVNDARDPQLLVAKAVEFGYGLRESQ